MYFHFVFSYFKLQNDSYEKFGARWHSRLLLLYYGVPTFTNIIAYLSVCSIFTQLLYFHSFYYQSPPVILFFSNYFLPSTYGESNSSFSSTFWLLLIRSPPNCQSSPDLKLCFLCSSTQFRIFIGLFSSPERSIGLLYFTLSIAIGSIHTLCVFLIFSFLCKYIVACLRLGYLACFIILSFNVNI